MPARKTGRQFDHRIAVRHPHPRSTGTSSNSGVSRSVTHSVAGPYSARSSLYELGPEVARHQLHAVADARDRHAGFRDRGSISGAPSTSVLSGPPESTSAAGRRSRQRAPTACRTARSRSTRQLARAPGDQLAVLRAEVENEDRRWRYDVGADSSCCGRRRLQRRVVVGFARDFGHDLHVRDRLVLADHHDRARQQPELADQQPVVLAEAPVAVIREHPQLDLALRPRPARLREGQIHADDPTRRRPAGSSPRRG